ncbi:TrbI/VirB10 family protein [Candidatus Enterovibrio escicola]|nr:TrbI/VirB10 family protein [Candidatus Enterovibrio escacola]
MAIGTFLLIGLAVIICAVIFAFSRFDEPKIVIHTTPENNFNAGFDKSTIDESIAFFKEMNRVKEREKQAEKERLAREKEKEYELRRQAKANKHDNPVTVVRVTDTLPPQPTPSVSPASQPANKTNKHDPPTPMQRKQRGSVMVNFDNNQRASSPPPREYDKSFSASSFDEGSVRLRKASALDFMLKNGTAIPCALYTQIISDYEGFVTCRVTQDVYSANGATLLVERGSTVSGTQKVSMALGKSRIFTNWADIETPLGVSIRIDSLGTGALGASGHEAWVDNHFAERFGGAILLSFVDDALGALSAQASKNGNIQFDNSTKNTSDMASKALEVSIKVAPTGYSYIGQRINILVVRDIDLSPIYHFGGR